MPNLHYWNSLLVLLLFLTLPPTSTMENAPNQELMDVAKNIVQKVKTIQKHCKDNNAALKTLLSKQEYKEYKEALVFIKTYLPEIKADILAVKNELVNDGDPTKDIEKSDFVAALIQWKEVINQIFTDLSKDNKGAKVNIANFSAKLVPTSIEITDALLIEWKSLLTTLPDDYADAEVVFAKLSESKIIASFTVANKKNLENIYKKDRKYYDEYNANKDKFITDYLPNKALFKKAIGASTDPKDKNLPENLKAKAEADKAKAEADKAKAEAYEKVLNAWLDREVANLSIGTGDDTTYVDMTMINAIDPRVSIHNLPIELKSNLLTTILDEAKKAGSRRQSVKNLKNIAINDLNDFHTQHLQKKENYQDLTLEEVKDIKFPTNISGWILNYQVSNKDKNPKIQEYAFILENWRESERASLDSSNASEYLKIDPVSLKINSNLVSHTGIPDQMRKDFLEAIKAELVQVEKQEGVLNFNEAATIARNQVQAFARDYNIDNTLFDYKNLAIEEIRKLEFPSGLHGWLKDAVAPGVKKDIKKDIKAQLKLTLKNTNNFNLEALIKELKIDMGGLTINNDFNFDNDMHLTYNSLSLILKELIEINKAKKTAKKPNYKVGSETIKLILKDFYNNYYNGCYYGGRLMLKADIQQDSSGACTFSLHKNIAVEKGNGSVLVLDKTLLEEIPPIKIKQNQEVSIKVDFALVYRYNQKTSISITKEGAYIIKETEGTAGIEVGNRFAKLYLQGRYNETKVPEKESSAVIEASKDKTFTDSFTFEIVVKNTANGLEFGRGKDISFADANGNRLSPQLKESVTLCGDVETKYTAQKE